MCFMGVYLVQIYAMVSIGNLAVALSFLGSMVPYLNVRKKFILTEVSTIVVTQEVMSCDNLYETYALS